jgi:hypothetical protein
MDNQTENLIWEEIQRLLAGGKERQLSGAQKLPAAHRRV